MLFRSVSQSRYHTKTKPKTTKKPKKKQNQSDLIPIPSKLVNKIRLITSTIDTVQHRLRREYMRCQFHQDTHRYYDDMCIAFHQDAYNIIENLIRHKLNRPFLYEIEREDEEFASLTIGHIRHVQKHFHRSFRMLLSIKELVKSISKKNNAYNAIEFENTWYSLYHNHFDQNN